MAITDYKISAFQKLIADLADRPDLGSSQELKQYFDSSPEELRMALNGLIDTLTSDYATKYDLQGVTLGQIPDGTITESKLAFDVVTQEELYKYLEEQEILKFYGW